MSDNKIIIRNCPCYDCGYCISAKVKERGCINCTDCVMKRIVNRCKKVKEGTARICTTPYEYATYCEANGVLQLLDIQEVE